MDSIKKAVDEQRAYFSSGMGSYHGEASFKSLSHHKSVLNKSNKLDIPLRYPPFGAGHLKLLKK